MKKLSLAIMAVFLINNLNAQEFMGVKVDGSMNNIIQKLSAKGFSVHKKNVDQNNLIMKGNVGSEKVEIYAFFTPISKVCWKLKVFLPEQTTWYKLKSQYESMLENLTEKYGEPTNTYNFFSSPYYEGDGYEMSAVALEKVTYSAFWKEVYIEITKFKQVAVNYENEVNTEKMSEEKKKQTLNAF